MLPRVVVLAVVRVPVRSALPVRELELRQGSVRAREMARVLGQMRLRSVRQLVPGLKPQVQARVRVSRLLQREPELEMRPQARGLETVKVIRLRQQLSVRARLPVLVLGMAMVMVSPPLLAKRLWSSQAMAMALAY